MSEPLLLTEPQAAKSLGVSAKTMSRLRANGEIEAIQIGRSVRYRPEALRALVERLTRLSPER